MKCPNCGSYHFVTERRPNGCHFCMKCWHRWRIGTNQSKQTLFDRITVNEETLAEKLVFPLADGWWMSTIIDDGTRFATKEIAIAATVAKLKGVCNE